ALENSAWIHRWPKPCCANSWMMKSCCASLKVKRSITSPVLSIAITKKPDAVAEKRANDLQTKDQTFFLKVTNINTVAAVAQGTLDQKTLVESALLYLCQIQHFFLFQSAVFILHHNNPRQMAVTMVGFQHNADIAIDQFHQTARRIKPDALHKLQREPFIKMRTAILEDILQGFRTGNCAGIAAICCHRIIGIDDSDDARKVGDARSL